MENKVAIDRLFRCTIHKLNGHLKREEESSIAESRPMRHPYKALPLTGATQSMMPVCRRSNSFGHIDVPDEFGCYQGVATQHFENGGWFPYANEYVVGPSGEVTGFSMPNGELASAEEINEDCEGWKTSFARDQRANFIQNHDHDCTSTCIKYPKNEKCYRVSSARWPKDFWAWRSQVPFQILPPCCSKNSWDRQICHQARQRPSQACLHRDRQRRERVWESHGANTLTLQIFFDGGVAVDAPL